jgi:hypothetical protein
LAEGTGGPQRFALQSGAFALFFRVLGAAIAMAFVIPAPWVACWFSGWLVGQIRLGGQPSLVFRGTPGSVAVLALTFAAVIVASGISGADEDLAWLQLVAILLSIPLGWAFVRWLVGNTQLAGRSLHFDGSLWTYIRWTVLAYVSIFTVIGWAWVLAAFYRWLAGHVHGAGGHVRFVGKGHQMLWRTIVYILFCLPIVTIPWAISWFLGWLVQQLELEQKTSVSTG